MIHHTCPCCEVHYPPHRDGCTFSQDCPEEFDDFNCVATLRQECDRLRAEVASVTLTDVERWAVEEGRAAMRCLGWTTYPDVLSDLLARAGGQTSGQDSRGQNQSAPENTPACSATEPASRAVTLTDAEREVLRRLGTSDRAHACCVVATSPEERRTIAGLLARAAKEGGR